MNYFDMYIQFVSLLINGNKTQNAAWIEFGI